MPATLRKSLPLLSRFAWLMELYGENYQRLSCLLDFSGLRQGRYLSRNPGGLDLLVDVLEVHPFTMELRLSYCIEDPLTGLPDPSAHVRVYRDARQAEVTHCYIGRCWQDVLGLYPPARVLFGHRLRMNSFLNKWLEYLAGQGHGSQPLELLDTQATDEKSAVCA